MSENNVSSFNGILEIIAKESRAFDPLYGDSSYENKISRLKVPNGWIYEFYREINNVFQISTVFVPDSTDEEKLLEKIKSSM